MKRIGMPCSSLTRRTEEPEGRMELADGRRDDDLPIGRQRDLASH